MMLNTLVRLDFTTCSPLSFELQTVAEKSSSDLQKETALTPERRECLLGMVHDPLSAWLDDKVLSSA